MLIALVSGLPSLESKKGSDLPFFLCQSAFSPWSPPCLLEIQAQANKDCDSGCPLFPERLVLAAFWAREKESDSSAFLWML